MHLLIISCTPRIKEKSNTDKIIKEFIKGYEENGHTTELFYLSKRNEWSKIKEQFYQNHNILFALPLYVECIPGIMMEFLEDLTPKTDHQTKIGFLLQGGFAEASQLRCCESYLEMLPEMLGCQYNGTLLKGSMFTVSLLDEKTSQQIVKPFYEMGKYYSYNHYFEKEVVSEFAKPEYFSKPVIFINNLFNPLKKLFFSVFAKKIGCKQSLSDKPYQKYVKR